MKKTGYEITLVLKKKESESWPRIPASKDKFQNISVDWNNWVDSDEEEEAED